MNVNDYAEKVLYSESLSEKLSASGETIEFDFRQADISPICQPGRPDSLQLQSSKNAARAQLPARPSLVDDASRGLLLHFFANHELLATELMALALLKFPDAPEDFRRGLYKTMRDEQVHTRWYLRRMEDCGVTLGDYPVSRFFWDTVSEMDTPFDYVSRLSLTFEQANLDYSRHYAAILREAGDEKSARIMDRIYNDEIRHVGYGLQWFRHWKAGGQSDWQAYRSNLSLPLSPSRAKGNGTDYNREGRLAAGLDDDFVRHLAVYERSKGRTPNVYYFNPDAEDAIAAAAQDRRYHPPAKVDALVRDLEILQILLARQDDVVLMRKPPSIAHLEQLKSNGLSLPEIEPLDAHNQLPAQSSLSDRKVNGIRPWAISPQIQPALPSLIALTKPLWIPEQGDLFSKCAQARHFSRWMPDSQVWKKIPDDAAQLAGPLVLKAPISAAGRGVKFFDHCSDLLPKASKWIAEYGEVLVEPAVERVFDFSVQYQVHSDRIEQIGIVRQLVDTGGHYRGSLSVAKVCRGLSPELSRYLMESALPTYEANGDLAQAILVWAQSYHYTGPLGIDAFVYRPADSSQELSLRAICEINPRYTMGRVTHEARKQIAPGSALRLSLRRAKDWANDGKNHPSEICLTEIDDETYFAATLCVDSNPSNL